MGKDADRKLGRASAGALVLLAKRAGKQAARVADQSVDGAVVQIGKLSRKDRQRRAEVFGIVLAAAAALSADLGAVLLAGRRAAREGARVRLAAELAAAGVVAGELKSKGSKREDEAWAATAAESASVAWRSAALALAAKASREEKSAANAIERTRDRALSLADRAARTETARAYSEEHVRALRAAADADSDLRDRLKKARVVRVWESALEKNTCERCEDHDGERVGVDEDFSGGDEPGQVHPHCLCSSYLSTD